MCVLICSFIFTLATGSSVVSFNDIVGHDIVSQVMEDNSPKQEVGNNVKSIDGQSMEEENKEAYSQQVLNPITEGTIGSNTDDTIGCNSESYYVELSHFVIVINYYCNIDCLMEVGVCEGEDKHETSRKCQHFSILVK